MQSFCNRHQQRKGREHTSHPRALLRDQRCAAPSIALIKDDIMCTVFPLQHDGMYVTEATNQCLGVWWQNIDTDQIIPAEYLTLVPSKVLFYLRLHWP